MMQLEDFWPEWHIEEKIGQGASGEVFLACRNVSGKNFCAAVKVIRIPQDASETAALRNMGMDEASVDEYFETKARSLIDEILKAAVDDETSESKAKTA